jgi:DNA-binding SARP family transcriptional activator
VRDGGVELAVTAARHRVLLAALLIRAGHVLSVEELAEAVWDGEPPPGARVTLRSYVKRLRQTLGPVLGQRIVARDPGYLITASDTEVDLKRFEVLCRAGRRAYDGAAWQEASDLLTQALGLWRGAPLADIHSQVLQRLEVPRLEQLRLQAIECQIDADLHLGHHGQLVPDLQALVAQHPMREHFHAHLMLALHRCGRRAEALAVYRQARAILVGELGIEPGPELRLLHQRILISDPEISVPAVQVPVAAPRQLPAAVPPSV